VPSSVTTTVLLSVPAPTAAVDARTSVGDAVKAHWKVDAPRDRAPSQQLCCPGVDACQQVGLVLEHPHDV
jgi:hypothetical protein